MEWPPLETLVPHRAPMLLLDRVTGFEGASVSCELTVREGAMFVTDEGVAASVFIEYMAQAAAAHAGLTAIGAVARAGSLLGAREFVLDVDRARIGEVLTVRATLDWDDGVSALYLGEVRSAEGRRYASAKFHVHRNDAKKV